MDRETDVRQGPYYETFDAFLQARPEIDPAWRGMMEPVFEKAETDMMSFLLGLF